MDVVYGERFAVVEIIISKIRKMRFYLTFGFLEFKVVNKRMMNLLEGSEKFPIFEFYLVGLKSINLL